MGSVNMFMITLSVRGFFINSFSYSVSGYSRTNSSIRLMARCLV